MSLVAVQIDSHQIYGLCALTSTVLWFQACSHTDFEPSNSLKAVFIFSIHHSSFSNAPCYSFQAFHPCTIYNIFLFLLSFFFLFFLSSPSPIPVSFPFVVLSSWFFQKSLCNLCLCYLMFIPLELLLSQQKLYFSCFLRYLPRRQTPHVISPPALPREQAHVLCTFFFIFF